MNEQDVRRRRDAKSLGKVLRAARRGKGLTREEMARLTQYSTWSLTRVEEGRLLAEDELVAAYAKATGTTVAALLDETDALAEQRRQRLVPHG